MPSDLNYRAVHLTQTLFILEGLIYYEVKFGKWNHAGQ